MTKRTYLLGYPVKGAASPVVLQAACDRLKIDVNCGYYELEDAAKLPEVIDEVRRGDALGIVVTMPFKESVIPLLDELDEEAKMVGAVNTVYLDGGKLMGHNSDTIGFMKSLTSEGGFEPKNKKVTILGAGGAARACGFSLSKAGVKAITLVNRNLEKAQLLASALKAVCPEVQVMSYDGPKFKDAVQGCDLLVDSTPNGMIHTPLEKEKLVPEGLITSGQMVYDVIYKPLETPFLKMAREAGAKTLNGMGWMIYGSVDSLRLFIHQEPDVEVMYAAARKLAKDSGW